MKNQLAYSYTVNELKQLIGIEDHQAATFETSKMVNYLMGRNLSESCIAFYTITDYSSLKYLFVSPNIERLTGHRIEKFAEGGLAFMLTLAHPDEVRCIQLVHQKIVSFLHSLPDEKKLDYCFCYNIRLRIANEGYIRLLCEFEGEILGDIGHILIGKEIYTEITQFDNNSGITLVIRHKRKTPGSEELVYHFNNFPGNHLTHREKEINELISRGKTSKEIARELHISVNTVNTHRRKISKKRR